MTNDETLFPLTITAIGGGWSVLDGGYYQLSGDWSFIFGEFRNLGQSGQSGSKLVSYFFWFWFFCISGLRSWMPDFLGKFTYASDCNQAATTASYLLFHLVEGCCFMLLLRFWCRVSFTSPFHAFPGNGEVSWSEVPVTCLKPWLSLFIFVSYLAFGSSCFNVRSASEIVDEKRKFLEKNFRVQQQLGSKVCWLLTWCEVGWFMICILICMVDSGCARTCWRVRRTRSPSMGLLGWISISLSCMLHAYVSCENAKSCQPR